MKQLRKIREDKNLKQKQLAALANVRSATICDIEKGRIKNPHIETLEKIACVLGVPEAKTLLDDVA
jgi:transcriptional regulator with XRE-family HTH domain